MNFIELDAGSLTIGYVCGTLLCWYLRDMLDAKESEYEREVWTEKPEEPSPNYDNSPYHGNYPYDRITSN
jgi:hypothetical protein